MMHWVPNSSFQILMAHQSTTTSVITRNSCLYCTLLYQFPPLEPVHVALSESLSETQKRTDMRRKIVKNKMLIQFRINRRKHQLKPGITWPFLMALLRFFVFFLSLRSSRFFVRFSCRCFCSFFIWPSRSCHFRLDLSFLFFSAFMAFFSLAGSFFNFTPCAFNRASCHAFFCRNICGEKHILIDVRNTSHRQEKHSLTVIEHVCLINQLTPRELTYKKYRCGKPISRIVIPAIDNQS